MLKNVYSVLPICSSPANFVLALPLSIFFCHVNVYLSCHCVLILPISTHPVNVHWSCQCSLVLSSSMCLPISTSPANFYSPCKVLLAPSISSVLSFLLVLPIFSALPISTSPANFYLSCQLLLNLVLKNSLIKKKKCTTHYKHSLHPSKVHALYSCHFLYFRGRSADKAS